MQNCPGSLWRTMRPPRRDGALKMGSVLCRSHGERLLEPSATFLDDTSVVPTGHDATTLGVSKGMVRPFGQVGSVLLECGFCELAKKVGSALYKQQIELQSRTTAKDHRPTRHNCNPKAVRLQITKKHFLPKIEVAQRSG